MTRGRPLRISDGRVLTPANAQKLADDNTSQEQDSPARRRPYRIPTGLRASGFREGFRRGALDLQCRALCEITDPASRDVLTRLADEYRGRGDEEIDWGALARRLVEFKL